jgi:hypothetical protein
VCDPPGDLIAATTNLGSHRCSSCSEPTPPALRVEMTRRATLLPALAVLTAICFLPAIAGSFLNWDDNVNFLENRAYRGLGPDQIRWALTSVLFGHYIPLTRLTWSLNYSLGGMEPWGYHLVNVLLHAVNAVLVYFVARRLLAASVAGGAQDGRQASDLCVAGAVTALVFGLHPLRVEPVAWVTGRADVLCATFVLLAALAYLRGVEGGGCARRVFVLLSGVALVAALLSKGSALPFVAALFLLDVYPLRRWARLGWFPLVQEKIPLLLVTLAGAVVVLSALRHGAVLTQDSDYGLGARLAVAAYSLVVSPARFAWPMSLSPLYEMPASISLLEPRFGFAVVAAALVSVALLVLRRRWPAGLAAWTFSALMLLPTSVALRKGVDLAPDRYSYLAGLGFAMLVGGAALRLIRFVRSGVLSRSIVCIVAAAGLVALAGLGLTSWSYAEVWAESESLWRWAVELDPACSVCRGKLGESVLGGPGGRTRAVEAETLFRQAITLRPDLPDAYFNLGTALVLQGRYAEAEVPLRVYMQRVPSAVTGPERLGLAYLLEGRSEEAIPLLRNAFVRKPESPGLRGYLIQALQARAADLRAGGRSVEADPLLAEIRVLGGETAATTRR